MTLKLKTYQKNALEALRLFFEKARHANDQGSMAAAFNDARREAAGGAAKAMPYRPLAQDLVNIPQVCIRIPTGGGKTLLAAHAIHSAAQFRQNNALAPVVLWLVPTNTIRIQTRDALLIPGHPYREALLANRGADQLAVLDIDDCEQLRAQDFGGKAIVIVATMQTLRVDKTAGRQAYSYKETFEPHFSALPDADFFERVSAEDLKENPALAELLGSRGIGAVKRSLVNLLAWYRPIVIVDEAHNHTTPLSNEVFKRIRPSCVIEWTATPAPDQNVLYHVSAQELKAEDMIKLPIVLSPHPNWQEAIRDAILTRERLAKAALGETEYIRPIVLFQADPINGQVPVEKLKQHLIETHQIAEGRIAVATGAQRELDGVDLFDKSCAIDFVITVEALKEGWDCSFAYIFCTVQNVQSAKDMEQLLGRVLRMPYAIKRKSDLLNRAYAHVCGSKPALLANQLTDRLVSMGFQEMEAANFIVPQDDDLFSDQPHSMRAPVMPTTAFPVSALTADVLLKTLPDHVAVESAAESSDIAIVTLSGALTEEVITQAISAIPKKEREDVVKQIERHQTRTWAALAPAQRGVDFGAVPQLAIAVQGELLLLEPSLVSELAQISLATAESDLPAFAVRDDDKPYLIDIERGHLRIGIENAPYTQLNLNTGFDALRREDIIRELDRMVRRDDLLQPDTIAWLGRVMDGLLARGIELNYLARHLNQLAESIKARLSELIKKQRGQMFQQCLLEGPQKATLSDFYQFCFDPQRYPASNFYTGRFRFPKHYYGAQPGELNDEEVDCALALENIAQVEYWVRNIERQPQLSFWLPTSTDRFYPDFVAKLKDGRFLVVEYKGAHLVSNTDTREKRDIGMVWASASKGRCVFVMATHEGEAKMPVIEQLRRAIEK